MIVVEVIKKILINEQKLHYRMLRLNCNLAQARHSVLYLPIQFGNSQLQQSIHQGSTLEHLLYRGIEFREVFPRLVPHVSDSKWTIALYNTCIRLTAEKKRNGTRNELNWALQKSSEKEFF